MGDTDISSYCSETSMHSELSNTSVSSLSVYKTEFLQLKNEIETQSDQYTGPTLADGDSGSGESNMSGSLKLPELYSEVNTNKYKKRDLYDLQTDLELKFYHRIERLLKNKAQLETQLNSANRQIRRFIENSDIENGKCQPSLDSRILLLENDNHNLYTENARLLTDINEYKSHVSDLQDQMNNMNSSVRDSKCLVTVRDACIEELKNKISEQCINIQKLVLVRDELTNKLSSIQTELEHSKKSEAWFKEQLHVSQQQKRILIDEISEQKKISLTYRNTISQLNLKLNCLRSEYEQSQLEIIKSHQHYSRMLNDSQKVLSEDAIIGRNTRYSDESPQNDGEMQKICEQYQLTIKELKEELRVIRDTVIDSQRIIKMGNKEKSELTAQCIKLQKILHSKENNIELLETQFNDFNIKLIDANSSIARLSKELLNTREEKEKLKVELASKDLEKPIIENTVSEIREHFFKLKMNYEKLKSELCLKDQQIIQLETEKQELFMNNNWKVCELERTKDNHQLIDSLKEQLKIIESEKFDLIKAKTDILERYDEQRSKLEQEIESVRKILLKTEEKYANQVDDLLMKIENYEKVIAKYKIDVTEYQNEVNDLKSYLANQLNALRINGDDVQKDVIQKFIHDLGRTFFLYLKDEFHIDISIIDIENIIIKLLKDSSFEVPDEFFDRNTPKVRVPSCQSRSFSDSSCSCRDIFLSNEGMENDLAFSNHDTSRSALSSENSTEMTISSKEICLQDIKNLQAQLQVKELEKKQLRNRHEKNNRTLLRKVKEHMKGRNAAEKHNEELQNLCKTLSQENHTLVIKLSSVEQEMILLREEAERLKVLNCGSLQQTTTMNDTGSLLGNGNKVDPENEFKSLTIEKLELEIQAFKMKETNLMTEKNAIYEELQGAKNELNTLRKELIKMKSKLCVKQEANSKLLLEMEDWKNKFRQEKLENERLKTLHERNENDIECMREEIKGMNKDLLQKHDYLKQLKKERDLLEEQLSRKALFVPNSDLLVNVECDSESSEIGSLRNEKFFLQRLCNDLKSALRNNIEQNMALKERISNISQEQEFNSLPIILPSLCIPNKLDEDYINKLLLKTKVKVKPLNDIQECLNSLKREVFTLREQVEKDSCRRKVT